jgi:DNA-binding GntR family transcriptional regulator
MTEMTGYAEIADHYRRQIANGELRAGDRLPPLREVMSLFGVAQQTASRAYRTLKTEGLTRGATGGGTVVAESGSSNISARVLAWAQTGKALQGNESSRIVEVGTVSADEAIAARLEIEPGSPVYVRRRVVSRGGAVGHMSSSYYPLPVIEATPELREMTSTGGSRELAAERMGAEQDRVLEEVTSRLATEAEKQVLGLTGPETVVTQVLRTVWLTNGQVIEVATKVVPGAAVLKWTSSLRHP